jgi:hypothetical protein
MLDQMDNELIKDFSVLLVDGDYEFDHLNEVMRKFMTQIWLSGLKTGVQNKKITISNGPMKYLTLTAEELVSLMK